MTRGLVRRVGRPTDRERAEREGPHGAVVRALGHEARRRIMVLLDVRPRSVHSLANEFDVSRPMVSKHLRVLAEAGLVESTAQGRERVYRLRPGDGSRTALALSRMDARYDAELTSLREHLGKEEASGRQP